MLIVPMLAGAALLRQKRVYRDVNVRIATFVQSYNNGNIIPFLRGISYNLAAQQMFAVLFDLCKTLKFAKLEVLEERVTFAQS